MSASTSSSPTSSFPTLSGPYSSHLSYHGSNGAHGLASSLRATGSSGSLLSIGTGSNSSTVRGLIPSSGAVAGSDGIKGILPPSGVRAGTATGFPQLQGFLRGHGVTTSGSGTASGISGGYGPSGSGASGSLGGWARNPACTASWNSRFSAANGTVMTTTTYSVTLTVGPGTTSTFRPGQIATGPTTATFNAGTVTYEVGSDSQCCGDCNVLYPNVRVYYWPTNNTNTWCVRGQKTIPAGSQGTGGAEILDPGLPNLANLPNLPKLNNPTSLTSTGPIGETTGALAGYTGIPPGGFGAEKRAAGQPMITPAPKLSRSLARAAHRVQPRKFIPLGGPGGFKGLPSGNDSLDIEPFVLGSKPSDISLGNSSGLLKEVIDVVDGMTFVSPTVYVVISTISAKDKCGTVGRVHTSLTLSYAKDQLSTVDAFGVTSSFNFADLPCPPSSWAFPNPLQGNTAALQDLANSYHPRILVPHTALQNLDQKWESCNIQDVGQGYDPPRSLSPQTNLVLPICSDGSLPDPNSYYAENTKSHCLDPVTSQFRFPAKVPVFKSQEPDLAPPADAAVNGPNYKKPNNNLAQVTPKVAAPLLQPVGGSVSPGPAPVATPDQPALAPTVAVQQNPPTQQTPDQPNLVAPPNSPAKDIAQPIQQQPAVPTPPSVVVDSSGTPLTLSQGGPSVKVGEQYVGLTGPNVVVGSQTAAAPVQLPPPTDSAAPIVAGGITLTPASTNPPAAPVPAPVQVAGLTFSAPQVKAQNLPGVQDAPAPQPAPVPNIPPVVAGGITYQPVAQGPTATPITVGGLTFNPVSPVENNGAQVPQAPPIGAPGQTGAANIVVGGQSYVAGVTAGPANAPVVENGVTMAPVPAGAPASTPLGIVGGQVISGGSSQAVVAGQTLQAGGPPVTIQGTPVSLGTDNIAIGSSTALLPASISTDTPAALGVVGGQVINGNSQSAIVAGQTISAGGPPVMIQGTPVSLGASNIVIGTNTAALPSANVPGGDSTNAPLGIVAGQVISGDKSHAVVDGQTILPGSAATISGTPVSLGNGNLIVGTDSIPLPTAVPGGLQAVGPSAFAISGSTVSNGGSPITVSGTRISLGPSGLVVGSSTIPLTNQAQMSQATGPPVYYIDGTGVTQGSPAVTVSGTRISLGSSNVVIGSSTIALPSSSVLSVGGQAFTPQAGGFSIDGTTITPGGPGVTISGTAVSIDSSSNLIIGSSTIAMTAGITGSPTLAVAGETLTARPKSLGGGFVVDGQTITPGAAAVTISGTAVSLNTASSLIVGSSTIALASAGPGDFYKDGKAPLTAEGETFTPLGASSVVIDGTTLSISGPAITDHGTVISLASGGFVVGISTFAYATPASNTLTSVTNGPISGQGASPSVFDIDGETFTAEASGLLIAGTDVSIGGSAVTINGTVISLASDSLIVGASTIPLASVSGLTAAIASATTTTAPAPVPTLGGPAAPANTGKSGKTGAAGRLEVADLSDWKVLIAVGLLSVFIAWVFLV